MVHLANLTLIALLLVNLTGLALATRQLFKSWVLARTASPFLAVVPFFVEHFIGLGSLHWMWPITTGASLWLINRHWRVLLKNWPTEGVFFATFAYALAWRYAFPDIDASSEKITDVTFVANYLPGGKLPPIDRWLPPYPFDMYYALQHYAAALMGRIFEMPTGTAYNLAICILVACAVTAAAGAAWLLAGRRRMPSVLLTVALLFGGTGVSPFIHQVMPSPALHSSIRFMGSALTPREATRPFGQWLVRKSHGSENSLDLPVELLSYLAGLGDFHPPLSGYLFLMLALLSIALIEAQESVAAAHFVLGATVPLTIASNAWDLPLQLFLAGAWIYYRAWVRLPVAWTALAAGTGASLVLIEPFLTRFASQSVELHNAIRFVPRGIHTPLLPGLLVFYPVLVLLLLHLCFGERTPQSLAFCVIWIALLAVSEFLFVDDIYAGKFERFNTVLKWWSWIYSGTLLVIGAVNLRSPSRICRWGTVAILLLVCVYARELAGHFFNVPKRHVGELDGAAWIRDDPPERAALEFLASQPPSTVLQRIPDRSYVAPPALTIFAGQTAFLGWPNHEDIWRGYRPDIDQRYGDIDRFYRAALPDAAQWLEQNHIRYVLWLRPDNALGTFDQLGAQLRGRYFWREFSSPGDLKIGVWSIAK